MSEKEAEKDLLFFLKVLQRNTTTDLGAFGTSGTREPKGSSDK
jgi:hypothetical protein